MVEQEFKEAQFTVDGRKVIVGHVIVENPVPSSTDPNKVCYWSFLERLAKLEEGEDVSFEVGRNACYLRIDGVAINDGSITIHADKLSHIVKLIVSIWVCVTL
ncbi:MAG: hypothetical protein LBK50_02995 [Candidatus Nomurabacteria bacterium]|jgi:hypothetical protein|nr:hypothetical protein [Candidatus Nomurabacteria bacterium]